jgi:hypothetical protein
VLKAADQVLDQARKLSMAEAQLLILGSSRDRLVLINMSDNVQYIKGCSQNMAQVFIDSRD